MRGLGVDCNGTRGSWRWCRHEDEVGGGPCWLYELGEARVSETGQGRLEEEDEELGARGWLWKLGGGAEECVEGEGAPWPGSRLEQGWLWTVLKSSVKSF